ncbi:MAG: hypothetical protein U0529_19160 [Thermoanaerobaculia bacterium]
MRARARRTSLSLALALLAIAPLPAAAQEGGGLSTSDGRFRLRGDVKLHFRDSTDVSVTVGQMQGVPIAERTPDPGSSFEVSTVNLIGEGELTKSLFAKVEIHFIDLYNRNPTSTADEVRVREAWLRFGKRIDGLKPWDGTSFYLQAGKAPRFAKQLTRRLESYGLWGTAVNRFEEIGVEAGGTLGNVLYWRAAAANGNPVFMRDPNALAGDNGTPDRTDLARLGESPYNSGFPILYDAQANDARLSGRAQVGGGLGLRVVSADGKKGIDVLGWIYHRQLADSVPIEGTIYAGDLDTIDGVPPRSLPIDGRDKTEGGVNVEARWERLSLFGQYVYQDLAGLVRKGYEVEAGYRFPLNGLFAVGDQPWFNWVQPAVRVSRIQNDFSAPAGFAAPSFAWDWTKVDFGVRVGIVRNVDLTAEYARNDMKTKGGVLHPDELLVTLRAGF